MSRPVAWLYLAVVAILVLAGAALSFGRESVIDTLLFGLLLPGVLAGSGFLVTRRQPRNPIGWLFCAFAFSTAIAELSEAYGYIAAERGLPAGEVGEWIILWSWVVYQAFLLAIFLLFPNGKLFSRRWRIALWIGLLGCAMALPGQALNLELAAEFSSGVNPFAVDNPAVAVLFGVGTALIMGALVAAVVCIARGRPRDPAARTCVGLATVAGRTPMSVDDALFSAEGS